MKTIKWLGLFLFTASLFSACFNPPEYPTEPIISFNSIKFIETPGLAVADTLALTLNFTDGDGDLGLEQGDLGSGKFVDKYFFKVGNQSNVYYLNDPSQLAGLAKDPSYVKYKTRKDPRYDTLPAYVKPFDCTNWVIAYETVNNVSKVIDTVYFQSNPNHYNIFIDFLVKQNDGTFTEFEFEKEFCTTYNGRVPVLSKDIGQETPLEGTIRYAMVGTGFKLIFSIKTLKLRIRVQDRSLNMSEAIETPPFTL